MRRSNRSQRSAQMAVWSTALVALALALAPRTAAAQATLLSGLGGPAGYGTGYVAPNDDGSSDLVDLSAAFPGGFVFAGRTYTSVYVNNNGNITLGDPLSTYSPDAFPAPADDMLPPIIAPWWGDVDTRGDSVASGNLVWYDLRPGQFVATWHNVGYYSEMYDRRNDFQMIVTSATGCGVGDFDVEFRYHQCQWYVGHASGASDTLPGGVCDPGVGPTSPDPCYPAVAGFDSGDGVDYVTLPGSATPSVLNLCTTSNVGMPGIWRFRVRGGALPCTGSGDPCVDTTTPGLIGACRNGTNQCRGMTSVCVASVHPSAEVCDGQDNDCNGMTDEGSNLCTGGQVCYHGACVGRCVEGSCFAGQTCTADGTCVETDCVSVMCPDGQTCRGGACVDACGGVYCPPPAVCQLGRCVDPCATMHCDTGDVCQDGRCQPACGCRACGTDQVCVMTSGLCVDRGCDTLTCPTGQVCRGGACVDPCTPPTPDMVVCGHFEHCVAGMCVDGASSPDGGTTDDGGMTGSDSGMTLGDVVSPRDSGQAADGGTVLHRATGCGCRTAGESRGNHRAPWALALAAVVAAGARRRRRAR